MWYKLDTLLRNNGLQTKTANGLEAIKMWSDGRLEELQNYCMSDVMLTARMMLLPSLKLPADPVPVPEHVYGLRPAVLAVRARGVEEQQRVKRLRETN